YRKVDELPFDFERRLLSIAVDLPDSSGRILITKGAPEPIVERAVSIERAQGLAPFGESERAAAIAQYHRLSESGLRVVAVAYRALPVQPSYSTTDEKDFVFVGF